MLGPAEREIRMIIRMISNLVPLIDDTTHERGIMLRVYTHEEKCCFDVCGFQDVEDFRRPYRVGAVVEGDGNLMLVARALMIERRKLGKFRVLSREIPVAIHCDVSHPVRATLVHRDNFAVTNVGNRVGALEDLHGLARLLVQVEVAPHIQCVPNRGVFGPEPVKSESAGLFRAHFAQLVEKCHDIQEPDGMFFVSVLKIKIRIVTWRHHFRRLDFRAVRAAHCFGKADQLRFFSADRPIVAVAAECDNPLFRICVFEQHMQPTLKP